MEPFFSFLVEHWILSSTFLFLLILFILNELKHRSFGIKRLTPQEVVALINHSGAVVVDIRPAEAFSEGHLVSAVHVPENDLDSKLKMLTKYKSRTIVLICASGLNSPKAGKLLSEKGFGNLSYLGGGLASWRSEGLPLTKK